MVNIYVNVAVTSFGVFEKILTKLVDDPRDSLENVTTDWLSAVEQKYDKKANDDVTFLGYNLKNFNTVKNDIVSYVVSNSCLLLEKMTEPRIGPPVKTMRSWLETRTYGYSTMDWWNLNTWLAATLATELETFAYETYTLPEDVVAGLIIASARIEMYPKALDVGIFEWRTCWEEDSLLNVSKKGFEWLIDNFTVLAKKDNFLKTWTGLCANILTDLANNAHGYPVNYTDGYEGWVADLRNVSELFKQYSEEGDAEAGLEAFRWVLENIDTLWD